MNEAFEKSNIQKTCFICNAGLLSFVLCAFFMYIYYDVTYMVYHSIPTIFFYIIVNIWIKQGKFTEYFVVTYFVIAVYMCAATICLGYNYGFHLYCMSMIPIAFQSYYIGTKVECKKAINPIRISILLEIVYIICVSLAIRNGSRYEINGMAANLFLLINSISVFFFIIIYCNRIMKTVFSTEEKLKHMAMVDELTDLYNRHFMVDYLEENWQKLTPDSLAALVDIDDFKKINDTYGHKVGDEALKILAELMKKNCENFIISRWGGEEFLLIYRGDTDPKESLKKLRKAVAEYEFVTDGKKHFMTISCGTAKFDDHYNMDTWIQKADEALYYGKNSGKNGVFMENKRIG